MTHPLKRLRLFVGANMDADPGHTPRRVQRTLDQVNHFLSSTFVHLASNSPVWWREFKAAARRIDFESASWALALQATAEPEAPSAGPAIPTALVAPLSAAQRVVMHDTSDAAGPSRTGRIPEHIRAIVPRNTEGQESCLRFFAGSMCYGGSKTKCASSKRTHI
ncbi:hypothetical protein PHMEG_00017271 [Phytophthora megakarya]|uniref:Uncharacterized protein n=1 Tax=Phytophthora megakarya TaxID=4795 RepID=A0A225VYT4_9STRA|nr:hypothetical protein PHMEG_00017271 [Phytophthora megakarya]